MKPSLRTFKVSTLQLQGVHSEVKKLYSTRPSEAEARLVRLLTNTFCAEHLLEIKEQVNAVSPYEIAFKHTKHNRLVVGVVPVSLEEFFAFVFYFLLAYYHKCKLGIVFDYYSGWMEENLSETVLLRSSDFIEKLLGILDTNGLQS